MCLHNIFIDGCESFLPYADEGLVKVRYYTDESWYSICADNINNDTANVICRENGYARGVAIISSFERTDDDYPIYSQQFDCSGVEDSLCQCVPFDVTCGNNAVMIQCVRQGKLQDIVYRFTYVQWQVDGVYFNGKCCCMV